MLATEFELESLTSLDHPINLSLTEIANTQEDNPIAPIATPSEVLYII